jgi:ribosomal protein S27AE
MPENVKPDSKNTDSKTVKKETECPNCKTIASVSIGSPYSKGKTVFQYKKCKKCGKLFAAKMN